MGQDSSHGSLEYVTGGLKLVGSLGGVCARLLGMEGQVLQRISVEIARNIDGLAAHEHHLVAQQHLLGHKGSEVAQKMAPGIQHQDLPSAIFGSHLGKKALFQFL